jgi:hypothetical protein
MKWLIAGGWQGQMRWVGLSRLGESGGEPFYELGDRSDAHRFSDLALAHSVARLIPHAKVVAEDADGGRKT